MRCKTRWALSARTRSSLDINPTVSAAQLKPMVGLRLAPRATAATPPLAELAFQRGLRALERGEDLARATGAFVGHHSAPIEPVIDDLDAGAPIGGDLNPRPAPRSVRAPMRWTGLRAGLRPRPS
jgi:hypothetical protein